ncbi:Hemolysin activation/secretion protein [Monaibacterium marinum]|uniref:Hemolysin activation/secretion protein n=1 Tax=Pontivivens marinum TaxID=1690039 RepID=A0A2C9CUG2_9RHOB|nr:ShlB/FhaC/HecB family hemolysin secretion/activation protein [Monaibacterium marinum]SOH94853.1 Hemolysin activation/secretion protein [Monaibacterium marinum]
MMYRSAATLALICAADTARALCAPEPGAQMLSQITITNSSGGGQSGYLSPDVLSEIVVQGRTTCPATVAGLTAIAEEINAAYDAVGARLAFAQPITLNGTVGGVELVEITYGQVIVTPTADTDPDYILRRAGARAGDLADLEALQARLATFPETEDIRVTAELDPGAAEGTTDLALSVEEPEPWVYGLTLSNDGAPEVGEWRAGASITRTSLTGLRDPLTMSVRGGQGNRSLSLGYSRPVGDDGTRISGGLSVERNAFVNATAPIDDLVNRTQTLTLGVSHPLRAGDEGSDILEAGLVVTRERSDLLGVSITEQDVAELSLGSSHVWRVAGESVTALSHRIGFARLDDGVVGATDDIIRWSGTALHARLLNEDWSLTGQFNWQFSNGPVAAAQRFSVAGAQAVRGYPASESGSDAGYSLRVELSRDIPLTDGPDLSGFAFIDAGRSWDRVTGGGSVANDPLYSAGFGVVIGVPLAADGPRMDMRITAAIPLRETATFTDNGDVELLVAAGVSF